MTSISEKSMKKEKIVPITIWRNCLFSKSFFKRMTCRITKIKLKIKQTVPKLSFKIRLETYGRQINGEVTKLALMDSAAPRDITNREIRYRIYLLTFLYCVEMSYCLNFGKNQIKKKNEK